MIKAKTLDISQAAKQSGLPASTLRYYEEKGLIQSVGRQGLRRVFDYTVLEQLDFIALARRADFSLEEITAMFAPNGRFQIDRGQLLIKADELDERIKQLSTVSEGLRHAAKCAAPSHSECPTFQKLLRLAGRAEARKRK